MTTRHGSISRQLVDQITAVGSDAMRAACAREPWSCLPADAKLVAWMAQTILLTGTSEQVQSAPVEEEFVDGL